MQSPPFRTPAKVRCVNPPLTGDAYNVADIASLAVRNAGANNVVILGARLLERLLALRGLVNHTRRLARCTRRCAIPSWPLDLTGSASPTSPPPRTPTTAVRSQALAGVDCRWRQKKYESPQSTPVTAAQPPTSRPSPTAT